VRRTPQTVLVIRALAVNPDVQVTVSTISKTTGLAAGPISRILDKLETLGWATTHHDPAGRGFPTRWAQITQSGITDGIAWAQPHQEKP
jgi:DNA-binding MarR family transcriptional regulator